jgi:hypothetical protein
MHKLAVVTARDAFFKIAEAALRRSFFRAVQAGIDRQEQLMAQLLAMEQSI